MAGMDKAAIDAKVKDAASVLNLTTYLDRRPRNLSGGQRQRVAIGRAIVREPKAFLFDEPLSNLDAALRVNMRLEISELHQQLKTTMVYVTHDQVEAMTMADRIVVLNAGNVEQFGTPMELYKSPANRFVAGFIGSPKMNFVDGAEAAKYNAASIGVRPEHIQVSTTAGSWKGKVGVAEHLGSDTFLHVNVDGLGLMTVRAEGEMQTPSRRRRLADARSVAYLPLRQGRPLASGRMRNTTMPIKLSRDCIQGAVGDRGSASLRSVRVERRDRAFRRRQFPSRPSGRLSRRSVQSRRRSRLGPCRRRRSSARRGHAQEARRRRTG